MPRWKGLCVGLLLVSTPEQGWMLRAQTVAPSNRASAVQAGSQEEFDAYLALTTEAEPRRVIENAAVFVRTYPGSELLGLVYQAQMRAYESVGDWNGVLAAGRKALLAQPDNLNTLLTLAPAIVNHPEIAGNRAELLDLADQLARHALAALGKTRPPHEVSIEQWKRQKRDMQSRCHEVLGVVALNRKQVKAAIEEFKESLELTPTPDGSQEFRLGVAYAAAGESVEAEKAYRRAVELGPENVRVLAGEELRRMSKARLGPAQ